MRTSLWPEHVALTRSAALLASIACVIAATDIPSAARAAPAAILDPPDGSPPGPSLFPVPAAFEPAIRFWTDIFARYDTDRIVFHDREDLAVVWKVLELPANDDGTIDQRAATALIKKTSEELSERLENIKRTGKARDDADRALLAIVGDDLPRLEGASSRVRAQRGIAGNFRSGLERAKQWLPEIKETLVSAGVPIELRALPFIESTFNPLARSGAGAAGLWQLMPATARQLGLRVNRKADERLDVLEATRAAAKMLRQNFEMLTTWPLAITGYNHGPYGVARAVRAVGSHDLLDLIARYKKKTFGFASKNFYVEFIAALRLVEKLEQSELAAGAPVKKPHAVD